MLNTNKHRLILFNLIQEIYQSPIGSLIGFKGGTMLYFFHGLDRFSVDLDFDLLDASKKDVVYGQIRKILQRYGKIRDEADKVNTLYFMLSYGEGEHGVKVEISKRIKEKNSYETKNFYGTDVLVVKLEDAFANKLVAATERKRTANRDFYDIFFLLKMSTRYNEGIVTERTGKSGLEYLGSLSRFIEKNISENTILEGIGELVDENKKTWIKKNLKKELLGLLQFVIDEEKKK